MTAGQLFELALLYADQGDLQRAEQYLSAAQQRGYEERAVVFWLIRVCILSGRYHSALEHADRYLRHHPNAWPLRFIVASIHEALGDFDRARADLEAIVQDEPNRALPHYRIALLYLEHQLEMSRARHHLQEYLRLAPDGSHSLEVDAALRALERRATEHNSVPVSSAEHLLSQEAP